MDQLLIKWPALLPKLEAFGLRLLGAVALAALGWLLIRFVVRLTGAALARAHIEPTIAGFVTRLLNATLTVFLIAMLLGVGGLQLASFAALVAGVGIAVGGAMSGLLGDVAAGRVVWALRPVPVRHAWDHGRGRCPGLPRAAAARHRLRTRPASCR